MSYIIVFPKMLQNYPSLCILDFGNGECSSEKEAVPFTAEAETCDEIDPKEAFGYDESDY